MGEKVASKLRNKRKPSDEATSIESKRICLDDLTIIVTNKLMLNVNEEQIVVVDDKVAINHIVVHGKLELL